MAINFKTLFLSFIVTGIFSHSLVAKANDHEAPKAEEHGSGGGGHGSADKAKTELPEWVEMQSRLMGLETQMSQKRELIRRLIAEKEHLKPNSSALKTVIDELISTQKSLQKLIDDYEKESTVFKYRFPERGAKGERTYNPLEPKALREMEQELGLDGRLNRNLKKIRSQYKSGKPEAVTSEKSTEEKKNSYGSDTNPDLNKSSGDSVIILHK